MAGDIFYTEVDPFLKEELNARGLSGFSRSKKDLDFMIGKIANVQMICYKGTDRKTKIADSVLGGRNVIQDEFFPSTPNGYLNNQRSQKIINDIVINNIKLSTDERVISELSVESIGETVKNTAKRVPPFIKQANIAIADNSRGLLNKATR